MDLSCYTHPVDDYSLDVFKLHSVTQGKPLQWVGLTLFIHNNLLEELNIQRQTLENFLREIENLYHPDNQYHNNIHAADVTWSMHTLLCKGGFIQTLTKLELFSCLVSAIIHDCDHPGQTNGFLISVSDPLAILHNDRSVLENHHCSISFQVSRKPHCNIFEGLSTQQYRQARSFIIDLVLGTDFGQHRTIMRKIDDLAKRGWSMEERDDRLLTSLLTLKCSDLGHGAKQFYLHQEWSRRVTDEFLAQGDIEKERNLPVSLGMDRNVVRLETSQYQFLSTAILPLFTIYTTKFSGCQPQVEQIQKNIQVWAQRIKELNLL